MTREEAIDWLKLACLPYHDDDKRVVAIQMAIADMKKQIPKRVVNRECPMCEEPIPRWDSKYCSDC